MVLMLNTAYEQEHRPLEPDPTRTAAHSDTALFFDCPDPDAAYAYFQSKSVNARAPRGHALRHEAGVRHRSRRLSTVLSVRSGPTRGCT